MKSVYFASDLHLGLDLAQNSIEREKLFVRWMDNIKEDCAALYLLGDVFDYWFEHNTVVPKGFTRLLGKIAEFTDSGIPVVMFTGNHDLWMRDYLTKELGVRIEREDKTEEIMGRKFFIGHGDQHGDPSLGFRFISKFFRSPVTIWLYKWIHPDITSGFAHWWSKKNRTRKMGKRTEAASYKGEDKEFMVRYAKEAEQKTHHDFYLFGHRHIELDLQISPSSRVAIIGDWLWHTTFAKFDGTNFYLDSYTENDPTQTDRAACTDLSNVC